MKPEEIANKRLQNQQISTSKFTAVKELVAYMGSMQAQDFGMAKWAVGLRASGCTDAIIEKAIADGEIIRTHVLRPTWHFVSADDVRWMMDLTSPRIKMLMAGNNRKIGLDHAIFHKSNRLLEKAFLTTDFLSRTEVAQHLTDGGIILGENRLSHILENAEQDQVICSGKVHNRKPTYALMDKHIKPAVKKVKEEALAELARRYFTSHGPATLHDFSWWSGLSLSEVRLAWELVKADFMTEKMGEQIYHFSKEQDLVATVTEAECNYFLPAFDEFLVGYANRNASLHLKHTSKTITKNGMFFPTIIVNGQVTGLWKKTMVKGVAGIEPSYFYKKDALGKRVVKTASKQYAEFLGRASF